jgi:GNAT superfamily N-acetyltransferase
VSKTSLVRSLAAADYQDAIQLYKELHRTTSVAEQRFGEERFLEIIQHPGTAIWGAELNGRIVSMATLHILPNMTYSGRSYCLVENVVTMKSVQRKGLAREVMYKVLQTAWSAGADKVMLLTGKMSGAKGFYEKLGFSSDEKFGMTVRRDASANQAN